jgi:hypothetical protein
MKRIRRPRQCRFATSCVSPVFYSFLAIILSSSSCGVVTWLSHALCFWCVAGILLALDRSGPRSSLFTTTRPCSHYYSSWAFSSHGSTTLSRYQCTIVSRKRFRPFFICCGRQLVQYLLAALNVHGLSAVEEKVCGFAHCGTGVDSCDACRYDCRAG